MLKNISG